MDPLYQFPLYYLPPGMPRPTHLVHAGGISLVENVGPADALPHEVGGTIYGGPWAPESLPYWKKTKAGWWVAWGDAKPHHLARLYPIDGPLIQGTGDHHWMVPKLLQFRPGFGLQSAVPAEFRDYEWRPPVHIEPLIQRLRRFALWTPDGDLPPTPDDQTLQLAIDILALNYHLSIHELSVTGWLTDDLVGRILSAAIGLMDTDGA